MSNIIRARQADMERAFRVSLERCAKVLDEDIAAGKIQADEAPMWMGIQSFTFKKAGLEITCLPEYDLSKPIPDPIPEPRSHKP